MHVLKDLRKNIAMAIVCKELGIIYIQVPGTGCSVVGEILAKRFGGCEIGRKHNTIDELISERLLEKGYIESCLVVANIRHPLDVWATYYQRYIGDWFHVLV